MLFGRETRTNPCVQYRENKDPGVVPEVADRDRERKQKAGEYADRTRP